MLHQPSATAVSHPNCPHVANTPLRGRIAISAHLPGQFTQMFREISSLNAVVSVHRAGTPRLPPRSSAATLRANQADTARRRNSNARSGRLRKSLRVANFCPSADTSLADWRSAPRCRVPRRCNTGPPRHDDQPAPLQSPATGTLCAAQAADGTLFTCSMRSGDFSTGTGQRCPWFSCFPSAPRSASAIRGSSLV